MNARHRSSSLPGLARIACAGLALAAVGRPASGQELPAPITMVDPSTAPFSSAELGQALLARLFPGEDAGPPQVRIAPAGNGAVTVEVGERSRLVTLGDRTGPAAARVVALVIAELMSDAAESEAKRAAAAPPPPRVTAATASTLPPESVVAAPSPAPTGSTAPLRLYLTGGVAKGAGAEELLAATVDADLTVPLVGRLRLAPSAGLVYTPTRNPGSWNEVSFSSAVARLLGGGSLGVLDLYGGPFVARYSIDGANPHDGVLFGAEVLARVAAPLSRRTRLVVATRGHAYGNRVRVVWADGHGYATPRLELTIGVGLAWDWSS